MPVDLGNVFFTFALRCDIQPSFPDFQINWPSWPHLLKQQGWVCIT